MIIWSSRRLEKALAGGQLSSWTKVKYLIIPAVIGALFGPIYLIRPAYGERPPLLNCLFTPIFGILTAYVTYRGIKKCFQTNEQIDRKAFFERFAVLTLPVLVKLTVIVVPCSIAVLVLVVLSKERFPFLFKRLSIFVGAFGPMLTYIFYALINNSFGRFGKLIKKEEPKG